MNKRGGGAAECFTCKVNSGREVAPGGTIYEDELWIADHGVSLLVAGYVVLKPKRHVHELADLDTGEAATLGTPGLGPELLPGLFGGERWRCTPAEAIAAAGAIRAAITP